jgi:hypothetical protein
MTVERLVQEQGIERTDIFITTDGADNSVGDEKAGSDTEGKDPTPESRDDAALEGKIVVSVDIADDARAAMAHHLSAVGLALDSILNK